jgi:NADH-quinone oxidoreductase subunit N
MIGLLLVIVGIGYKIAAWPLHFYAPDVYQGAATPVTAFLAFAPKTAGMVAIISILNLIGFDYASQPGQAVQAVLIVMAVVTMSLGNVMALLQRNIKRIFAYSSIAHSGYMLVGLIAVRGAVSAEDGISATIFYLTGYVIMNLGAFAVLIYLQGKADAAEDLDDIAGVAKAHPGAALMMALCLFSLIGMPLTVGFLGKFYLVQRALSTGHTALAVILVLNAAVAAAYYLRIVAAMYLREALYPFVVRNVAPIRISAILCTIGVVALFVFPRVLTSNNRMVEPDQAAAQAPALPTPPALP